MRLNPFLMAEFRGSLLQEAAGSGNSLGHSIRSSVLLGQQIQDSDPIDLSDIS
jgi:hypothetical protein